MQLLTALKFILVFVNVSHFATAKTQVKNCRQRMSLSILTNGTEKVRKHNIGCISVMRAKVLNLNKLNINKHSGKPKMKDNSKEFSDNLVKNFRQLFFTPEIEKRKIENIIGSDFELIAGQVIFFPNGTQPLIRLNNEVSADAKLKLIENENGEKREFIDKITLNEKEFENCGHATFIFVNNKLMHCSFDFNRNKAIVKNHLNSAKEFFKTAKFASKENLLNAFIDNAFSTMELLAKSELLLEPMSGLDEKANHNRIKSEYNKRGKNVIIESEKNKRKILNKLSELRNKARYLKGDKNLSVEKEEIIETIENIIKHIESITEF